MLPRSPFRTEGPDAHPNSQQLRVGFLPILEATLGLAGAS